MLTVKHIDSDGSEIVISCERLLYKPDKGSAECFGSAGLYLDPEDIAVPDGNGGYSSATKAKACFPSSRIATPGVNQPIAYVMNERGATVARYDL